MAIWNLPPFAPNAAFGGATDAGSWALPDSGLNELGTSLRTDEDPFTDLHEPIRAIPDPWAQARTFAEALITGTGHSMYRHALPQWRGLLATFALAELYSNVYTISGTKIELGKGGGEDKIFDRVLRHLTPQIAIGDKHDLWKSPTVFKLEDASGRILASFLGNPASLVSSGRLTADQMIDTIPWFRNGLSDPLTCNLPMTQLVVLEKWLRDLHRSLEKFPGTETGKIRDLIQKFGDDCDAPVQADGFSVDIGSSLMVHLDEPFSQLGRPASLKRIAEPWSTSATRLDMGETMLRGNFKGVILADPALGQDDRFPPNRTLVWGMRTLSEVIDSPAMMNEVRLEAAAKGWLVATAEDLFTPRVVQFGNGATIPGNPAGAQDMLVPLRSLALLLAGRVHDRVRGRSGGGRATFTFSVDIAGQAKPFELIRNYSFDPSVNEGLLVEEDDWGVCQTSVWPDIRSKDWNEYYLRVVYPQSERADMVRPELGVSSEIIADEVGAQGSAQAAIDRLLELNDGRKYTADKSRWQHSSQEFQGDFDEIQFSPKAFEAIAYTDALTKEGDALAGMAFLRLETKTANGSTFPVAVDFGTTNTVACIDGREAVSFMDRVIHPIVFGNPSDTEEIRFVSRWLLKRFYPADRHSTPCPTVALNRVAYPSSESRASFRNLIYFHTHEAHAGNEEQNELEQFVRVKKAAKFNLKWSNEPDIAEAAEDYLRQFMTMIALEALAGGRDPRRIRWRFSVPDSLDGEMRAQFLDTLNSVTSDISTAVQQAEERLNPLYSEGLSAAGFILNHSDFVKGSVNLVLDIGGGTTDVTIWDVERLCWKGSFQIAGRDFFTNTISQNPEVLEPIGLGHWIDLFSAGGNSSPEQTRDLAEMLFSGPALQEAIDEHWSKLRIKTGLHLRLTSLTFLGGLAWYLGRIVKKLHADGVLRDDQLVTPAFALCGRGAGIFKKMHAGRGADASSEVTNVLSLFSEAAEIEGRPRPQLFATANAKLEVVGGMISDDGQTDMSAMSGNDEADNFVVAGLGLEMKSGDRIESSGRFSRSQVTDAVQNLDVSDLDLMVEAFSKVGKIEFDLKSNSPQGAHSAVQQKVLGVVNAGRKHKDPNHEIEPPFITGLRTIVEAMASPRDLRDKRLTVDMKA